VGGHQGTSAPPQRPNCRLPSTATLGIVARAGSPLHHRLCHRGEGGGPTAEEPDWWRTTSRRRSTVCESVALKGATVVSEGAAELGFCGLGSISVGWGATKDGWRWQW
jgi:hypothetical protein